MLVRQRSEVQEMPLRRGQEVLCSVLENRLQRPDVKPVKEVSFTSLKGVAIRHADIP